MTDRPSERLTDEQVARAVEINRKCGDLTGRALLQVSADLSAAKAIVTRLRELRPCNGLSHPADGKRWDYHICLRKTGADILIASLRALLPEAGR